MPRTAGEMMTIDEIHRRYPDEWVLLADPEATEMHEVRAGRVIWHGKDREQMHDAALESEATDIAAIYTGAPPADMEFAL